LYYNIRGVYTKMDSTTDKQSDLSQKTVVVLVVLTVLISIFGTFAVLDASKTVKVPSQITPEKSTEAKVRLNILNPSDLESQKNQGSSTGRVALEILPPKQN